MEKRLSIWRAILAIALFGASGLAALASVAIYGGGTEPNCFRGYFWMDYYYYEWWECPQGSGTNALYGPGSTYYYDDVCEGWVHYYWDSEIPPNYIMSESGGCYTRAEGYIYYHV